MLSVSGAFVSVVEEWLQSQGYGRSELCLRIRRIRPDATVDIPQAEAFLAEAVAMTGHELAALDIGRMIERRHLGAIGHMLAGAETLEQMLTGYVYYESLFYGESIANIRRSDDGLELYWALTDVPEHYARFAMACFASVIEKMGLPRRAIRCVSFPFPASGPGAGYVEKIGCDSVVFEQVLGIQFARSFLQRSLRTDEGLQGDLYRVKALLPELEDRGFAVRLYNEIVSALPRRQAKLPDIARQMAVSERTLQRRLSQCNDGLRGVIGRIRMHLASEYLKDPGMNLLAVSLLLGYSEQSAFQLAFKQCYGVSPGKWRRQNEAGES